MWLIVLLTFFIYDIFKYHLSARKANFLSFLSGILMISIYYYLK